MRSHNGRIVAKVLLTGALTMSSLAVAPAQHALATGSCGSAIRDLTTTTTTTASGSVSTTDVDDWYRADIGLTQAAVFALIAGGGDADLFVYADDGCSTVLCSQTSTRGTEVCPAIRGTSQNTRVWIKVHYFSSASGIITYDLNAVL